MKKDIVSKKNIISVLISLILIGVIISIFYSIFLSSPLFPLSFSSIFYKIGQFLGLIGFLSISLLIISGDSAKFFDKYFGIDKIIKTQRKFAIFTYFIVFSHPLFIILGQRNYLNSLIPNFTILPLAAGAFALYIFIGVMLSSLSYKRISYEIWQYIHIATYILFALIWYHSFNTGSSISFFSIKLMYYFLPILVLIGLIYRTNYKLKQRKNSFSVKEVRKETEDTFTLVVQPKKQISFKPGQFFFLRLDGRKLYARHPFSVSSSPDEKNLSFTIKLAGRFTQHAQKLKPGENIQIEGPFGNFIPREKEKEQVFIAGGVGITPFMSMINYNKNSKVKNKITLLYGSKKEKDIIFKKELDSISESWLKKVYLLSQEQKHGFEYGRINKEIILKYLPDIKNKIFYICGPKAMNLSVSHILTNLGVNKKDIITENFFW